jgi:hypothetical protein
MAQLKITIPGTALDKLIDRVQPVRADRRDVIDEFITHHHQPLLCVASTVA